jgi:flagella basal body P-ring formation protein FlgA
MTAWLILFSMIPHPQGCQHIAGEWILGADLARALPAFRALPREVSLGYAPAPGTSRVFLYPELKRIGTQYGILAPEDARACFEWSTQPLNQDAVRAAILQSIGRPGARVDVVAMSPAPAPEGKLEFPLAGLSVSGAVDPATPVLWRGHVVYAGKRRFAVWATVRVAATMTRVVAVEPLTPAKAVEKHQVRLETYDEFPLPNGVARNVDQVIGRTPRRAIRANRPVMLTDLAESYQVQRGERVAVTVISGAAQVELEALAETSGGQGDVVTLRNPGSGKSFQARVEGKDRALVVASWRGTPAGAQ